MPLLLLILSMVSSNLENLENPIELKGHKVISNMSQDLEKSSEKIDIIFSLNETQDAKTVIPLFQYILSVECMVCLNRFSFGNTCNISHITLLHHDNKDPSPNTCEYMLNKCKDNCVRPVNYIPSMLAPSSIWKYCTDKCSVLHGKMCRLNGIVGKFRSHTHERCICSIPNQMYCSDTIEDTGTCEWNI